MKMLASRVCLAGGVLILATTVSAGQAFADKEGPSKRGHGHSTENAEGAEPEKGVGGAASRLHSHRPIALPPPATVTHHVSRAGPSSAGVPAPVTAAPRQATTP